MMSLEAGKLLSPNNSRDNTDVSRREYGGNEIEKGKMSRIWLKGETMGKINKKQNKKKQEQKK